MRTGRHPLSDNTDLVSSTLIFRKACTLTYTRYLHKCATSLGADQQHPSDLVLSQYVQQLRIVEDVTKLFEHGSSEVMHDMSDGKIQLLLNAFIRQLSDWRTQLPKSVVNNCESCVVILSSLC